MEDWQIALIVIVCVILVILLVLVYLFTRKYVVRGQDYEHIERYEEQKQDEFNRLKDKEDEDEFNRQLQDQLNKARNKRTMAETDYKYEKYDRAVKTLEGMRDVGYITYE
jgi:septation ring formation regulator EzrA